MHYITDQHITEYRKHLHLKEKSPATIAKYLHAVQSFVSYLDGAEVSMEAFLSYRAHLLETLTPQTVNGYLSAIHGFFCFLGWEELRMNSLRIQRCPFLDESRELTREEYRRLVNTAYGSGRERLALVIQTLCASGMRVSELRFITVEAVRRGEVSISLKGKNRTILLPTALRSLLLAYAQKHQLHSGLVFRTKNGNPLDRSNIAHEMKSLCEEAGVDPHKVFPHNLRHLFARCFYAIEHNIAHLADVLGHSRIETTRIYVATPASEHRRILDRMQLVC